VLLGEIVEGNAAQDTQDWDQHSVFTSSRYSCFGPATVSRGQGWTCMCKQRPHAAKPRLLLPTHLSSQFQDPLRNCPSDQFQSRARSKTKPRRLLLRELCAKPTWLAAIRHGVSPAASSFSRVVFTIDPAASLAVSLLPVRFSLEIPPKRFQHAFRHFYAVQN
jgi:hypothetical protein